MKYAYVSTNLTDLWSRPKYGSERINQLMFHDLIETGSTRNGFVSVRKEDGYRGWADRRFLAPISKAEFSRRKSGKRAIVVASRARLYNSTGNHVAPFWIYYGTKISTGRSRNGLVSIIGDSGNPLYVKQGAIEPILSIKGKAATGPGLVAEAKRFLGVPYLWGGLSPLGFDCSGLVQAVAARFGLDLPRDTKDQIRMGEKIPSDQIRPGDLLFFDRHVGFALTGDRLIHCSVGGSGVRINSLLAGEPDYREDLATSLKQVRRLI